ncbi:MAG: hypothetical protein AB8V06_02475 [Francisella endosymbiont of Hyalomma asiaticum]
MALSKTLKSRHIELIALGGIIGSCFFLGTGYVLTEVGPTAILAYILAGIILYSSWYYRICGDFVLS